MCASLEVEEKYGFCFDKFCTDLGEGYDKTIQYYLLQHGIVVKDEYDFGHKFIDFLEECDKEKLIEPE